MGLRVTSGTLGKGASMAKETRYRVKVTFEKPQHGYWNGGKRRGGTFKPDGWSTRGHPGPGHNVKWGCFGLNFWVVLGSGRSWREAASICARWVRRHVGVDATVKLEEFVHNTDPLAYNDLRVVG